MTSMKIANDVKNVAIRNHFEQHNKTSFSEGTAAHYCTGLSAAAGDLPGPCDPKAFEVAKCGRFGGMSEACMKSLVSRKLIISRV